MKFQIEKTTLEEQLNTVSRAINNKTTLPVLGNVLLKVENGSLKLTTTNLEIAIETSTPVFESEDGETTVPVKLLLNYVNLLPKGLVNLEMKEKETLNISSETSNTNIKCIPATEFPIIPKSQEELSFDISAKELHKAFIKTVFAAAIDGRRPVLAGVFLKIQEKELTVVATDSYRLAEQKINVDIDKNCAVIIPAHTVLELVRVLSKHGDGDMTLKVSKNQIIFNVGSIFIISRLIEGMYPEYGKIIPQETTTKVRIPISELVTILKRVNLFAKDVSGGIKISVNQKGIEVISDNSQLGTEKATCDCKVEGEDQIISFNAEYVIDALNSMEGEEAILGLNNSLTPGVLRNPGDESYTHIIMPLKI